ncbi:MAG TPA: translation initiation factor [Campylobacterales bacterium]|nr:translation initiation factor [Campylobacterales bacterium]
MNIDLSQLFNGRELKDETPPQPPSTSSQFLHFRIEKRRGKYVTLVGTFQGDTKELLKSLKKELATGGTIRGEYLEFQGDIRDRLKTALQKRGFKFRK